MKARKFTIILSAILAVILIVVSFYAARRFIFDRIRFSVIKRVESSTGLGIQIENVSCSYLKGLCLGRVTFYKNTSYKEKLLSASHVFVKFPVIKLLINKMFSPTVSMHGLKGPGISASGTFGMEMKTGMEIASPEDALKAVKNIWFRNLSIEGPVLNIENLNGAVDVSPTALTVSSSIINLTSSLKKENEVYKISELKGNIYASSFDFMGEISPGDGSPEGAILSLYGTANIDVKDIARFVRADLRESFERLKPAGILENSVYFKTGMRNMGGYELGIKSGAKSLNVGGVELSNVRMDTRITDGTVQIPLLNAYLYGGTLVSSATLGLGREGIPCQMSAKLSNIKIAELLKNTKLKGKGIKGDLFIELSASGNAKIADSLKGPGRIVVKNANLGPMPLLTPLLGHIYGYLQHTVPELKKINIKGGTADFYIADRRLTTENLALTGDIIGINAKGYLDFAGNLDFEVENQVLPKETTEENDWQASLQVIIADFGKMISKARLTGTLQKPKWKFEYFGGVQKLFKGGLKNILKDILE